MASIPGNQFVQVQHRPRDRTQGRESDGIDIRRQRRLAFTEQLTGTRRLGREPFQAAFVQAAEQSALFSGRGAIQRAIEYPCEPTVEGHRPLAGTRDSMLRERARAASTWIGSLVNRVPEAVCSTCCG